MRFIACTARRRTGAATDEMVVVGAAPTQQDAISRLQEFANAFYLKEPDGALLLCTVIELNDAGDQVNTWDISLEPMTIFHAVVTQRA